MTIPKAQAGAEIQFPAWNALYQIRNFVRNVDHLEARCDGRTTGMVRVDLETWRSGPEPCSRLELSYGVYANQEGPFAAVLNDEHSFMNFALLLFYLPEERGREARVRFVLPEGWKLATLLDDGDSPGEFKASNYDALADSPAEAGTFQEYSYFQNGATYSVVVHADPTLQDYSPDLLLSTLRKITAAETALMRDVPFRRYTFIFHFLRGGGGGGMEHRFGAAISISSASLHDHWERLESTAAHEFFHAWNVKRIRPQGLEPIDYLRGNDTRDLWFSEGVTSSYAELVLLRAGLASLNDFYKRLGQEIQSLQARPARKFQSAEISGLEAWLEGYPEYSSPERSISYYNKGELLGYLLDLGIRHATRNRRSLDDVMRSLNDDFARRGRFFTERDLETVIAGLTPEFTDVDAFFREYIAGTSELDYDTYLGYAGLRLVSETLERATLGFQAARNPDEPAHVEWVDAGRNAARAGLKRGDLLLTMNKRELTRLPQDEIDNLKPGQKITFQVRRRGQELEIEYALEAATVTAYRVEENVHATEEQLRVRRAWLEGN